MFVIQSREISITRRFFNVLISMGDRYREVVHYWEGLLIEVPQYTQYSGLGMVIF